MLPRSPRVTAAALPRLLLLPLLLHVANARPSYRALIPNGFSVPDGDGGTCFAPGHTSCYGGGSRNQFGVDLQQAGFQWTVDLCMKDSDGDGISNGYELGDPCCRWASDSAEPPALTDTSQLSHPGLSASIPAQPATVNCQAPAGAAGQHGAKQDANIAPGRPNPSFFNPGERQRQFVLEVDTEIPGHQDTTYLNVPFNLDFLTQAVHLVGFNAVIDNAVHVHHFLMYACPKPFPEEELGIGVDAFEHPDWDQEHGCYDMIYGWGPGQNSWNLPRDVGMLVGPRTAYPAIYIQMHYDNPNLVKGQTDKTKVLVNFTPDLRQHNMGVLWLGNPLIHERKIPQGSSSWGSTQRCKLTMDEKVADEIHVFLHAPHMHKSGKRIWSETVGVHVGTGRELLASGSQPLRQLPGDQNYDFAYQLVYPANFKLGNNDLIATTCVYNVSLREGQVSGGLGSYDEMCINFMGFYPAEALPVKVCQGDEGDDRRPFFGPWDPEKKSVMEVPELAASILMPDPGLVHGYPHYTAGNPLRDIQQGTKFAGPPVEDPLDMADQAEKVLGHTNKREG